MENVVQHCNSPNQPSTGIQAVIYSCRVLSCTLDFSPRELHHSDDTYHFLSLCSRQHALFALDGRRTIWRWPNNIVTRSRGEVLKTVQSKIVVASDDDCYALSFGESKSIWGDYMGIYFVASLPGWDGRKYKKLLHRKTHWNMNHRTSGQEQQ